MSGPRRYGWLAGVVGVLLLVYIALNTLRTSGIGGGVPPGQIMPPFAVPLATSDLEGAANLAVRPGPGAGRSGRHPACAISDPRVLNLCAVAGRAPLVLAFATVEDAGSVAQLDAMKRVARASPDVRFAAVMTFGSRDATRRLVAARRWSFPVGYDRSGDVLAAYGVPAVPALTLAYRGRRVMREVFSTLDDARLSAAVRALRAGPPPRGATVPVP